LATTGNERVVSFAVSGWTAALVKVSAPLLEPANLTPPLEVE